MASTIDEHQALEFLPRYENLMEWLKIPLSEIRAATHDFDKEHFVASGGFGSVYKGELDVLDLQNLSSFEIDRAKIRRIKTTVAIKCIHNREDEESKQGFLTEIDIFTRCKHPNIIPLLGFCIEARDIILVYEYATKGSLGDYLESARNNINLTWAKRIQICLDIAHGINYLHTSMEGKPRIIHRDIKSENILLDENLNAKVADFELSRFHVTNQPASTIYTKHIAGTQFYLDPEYEISGKLKKESDIYSFGVVLFEMLSGRLAYDQVFMRENDKGLAPIAKRCINDGTLKELIDPKLIEEDDDHIVTLNRGPNQESMEAFSKIAYQCLAETQAKRPTMEVVIKELQTALKLQLDRLEIQLEEIVSATNNFADKNLIKEGGFGKDYKGQMLKSGQLIDICARRLKPKYGQGDIEFRTEISILRSLKHKNIISFIGFCEEKDEKIIVYKHAVHGSLDQHLSDPNLTWFQRLKICLGVARAMSYIHYDVIHCDINSSKIFLDEVWEPKISGFEVSTKYPQNWRHRLLLSHHFDNPNMTPKYDVYCFGVLLFDVLYGKKPMKTQHRVKVEPDDIINPNLLVQMDRQSLTLFTKIIDNCLDEHPVQRPTMDQVVKELEDVFELQWKHENLERSTPTHEEGTSSNQKKMECMKIPLSKIKKATGGFNEAHFVASGTFGSVYRGELDVSDIHSFLSIEGEQPKIGTKTTVAIKCINDRQDEESFQGFLTEIELLTNCKHPNIISLLGFYMGAHDIMLVYEYASKGSLSDYLGSKNDKIIINLTWAKRIQICLDIAQGINYLHTNMEGKRRIIHRDIKSDNILLDENLNAKVADFGLSKFHSTNQQASTIHTKHVTGTDFYIDPEYQTSFKYKKESDVYSFGVVLFEMLSGRLAYEAICTEENSKGLAPIARRRFNEGSLKELIDPKMIEEDDEHIVTLNRGPNQESFEAFSKIAYRCLAETQARRPPMEEVITELQTALDLQGETMVLSRFRLSDIMEATKNFADTYCIGLHEYGKVYKAELEDYDNKSSLAFKGKNDTEWPKTRITVAIKHISSSVDVKQRFFSEIEMRTTYKHPNVVSLLGLCDEGDENILVYEHASNKSLDEYLKNVDNKGNLTWAQRLHLCLAIARGLNHLHTKMDSQKRIIHGDIMSANIIFDKNWEPKIAYFGISKFHLANQEASTLIRTQVYRDPELKKTPMMKEESDVYSFGVILFEIFCGKMAYDPIYIDDNNKKGLPSVVRNRFNDGTIKELLDPKLKEVAAADGDDDIFTSNRGPNQDSLDTYLKIAYRCLEEAQAKRPTMEIVIKELEMALNFQENLMKNLELSLKDIEFIQENYFGSGRYWDAYKGKIAHDNANANAIADTAIIAKRWGSKFDDQFRTELDILSKRKHKNVIGLIGYCQEVNTKIIVYENMSKGSLDKYIKDSNLRWIKRLQICIDVASALEFLHGGDATLKKVVHSGIKSRGILLNDNWDAKISNFDLSSLGSTNEDLEHISDDAYLDPQYKQGFLTEKSDIYSFGVVLFEILCGRLARVEGYVDNSQSLGPMAKDYYEQGKLDEMVFNDIKEQIVPQSLTTFANIAYRCLDEDGYMRPDASEVVIQLKEALEFQEDSEVWEPKLPKDYKEIMELSQTPDISEKKDTYTKLSDGILLLNKKVWYILSDNGEANKMISATAAKFCYKNHKSHKFRSTHLSRFQKAAKMLDISNLNIQFTIDNRFLSSDVIYGVYLVFRFSDPRIFSRKRMYMNLKYKSGTETLHSYFATWRDDEWMMIELHRFLNHKEDVSFAFLLESFSRHYYTSSTIFIEGIEFRAIKKMAREDIKNVKEVQQVQRSSSDLDDLHHPPTIEENEKLFQWLLKGKKHLMVNATTVLHNSEKWKSFRSKSSSDSRFSNVMELLPQQVFRIKYKIKTEMLSPFAEYTCYLVFKVSEKCEGLHCPVKVRNLLYGKNKEHQVIYFRSPSHLNHHDDFWVPQQRKDGWMEVMIWKFNSKYNNNLEKDVIPMNLKLVTYEGTMSGLVICGLEFRPM